MFPCPFPNAEIWSLALPNDLARFEGHERIGMVRDDSGGVVARGGALRRPDPHKCMSLAHLNWVRMVP